MREAKQTGRVSLGIDVATAKCDVAVLLPGKLARRTCAMDATGCAALATWVRQQGAEPVPACLEATGAYGAALALFLYEAGSQVSLVTPARIAADAKSRLARTKTDQADAALSAPCCQTPQPLPGTPPAAEVRALQALVRRVELRQERAQQEVKRQQRGIHSPAVRASREATRTFLRAEVAKTPRLIQEPLERSAELQQHLLLLRSSPGVGAWTAARVRAEIDEVRRAVAARQLAASAGLTPRERTSGSSVHRPPRLAKTGTSR